MKVYAILVQDRDGNVLLPNYFNSYKKAVDEVKRRYEDWDDRYDEDGDESEYTSNEVDVPEGHKIDKKNKSNDENLTELYIEPGINIHIRKLTVKPKSVTGGYSRKRHRKSNAKSRKRRF